MWWTMPEAGGQLATAAPPRTLSVAGRLQHRQRTVLTVVAVRDVRVEYEGESRIFREQVTVR